MRLGEKDRSPGPTGFSAFADEVEVSLRDVARMMLTVSDNTATDVLLHRVGMDAVNETISAWGLADTAIVTDVRELLDSVGRDAGFAGLQEFRAATEDPEVSEEFAAELVEGC